MNRLVILLALAAAAGSAEAAKEQLYKWTDANGVVHFSDSPPPKETPNVQSMRLVGGTTTEIPPAAATDKPVEAAAPGAAAAAGTPPAADAAKECDQAKRNLALLQSNTPVGELGPDGKVHSIEGKDRESRIAGVQERIAQNCGSSK